MRSVCVYCGSRVGTDPLYAETARRLGRAVAARGMRLVYGGGGTGLMGVLADAALEAGGEVHGVIPGELVERELAHTGLTEQHVVSSMHERKALMAELSEAFVAQPGGIGTLEEIAETLTWLQLGIHDKPAGFLDAGGYWRHLLACLDHFIAQGFLRPESRGLWIAAEEPEALLDALSAWEPVPRRRWLRPEQA